MKTVLLTMILLAWVSRSSAQTDASPSTFGDYAVAEVHFGWEGPSGDWHGGGNYIQAKTTDGKYFVYYVNHINCSEDGAKSALAVLLMAKSTSTPVRFVTTKRAGDSFRFRDIQLLP